LSDRWLLQFYSGSKEQAYFSIGIQISNAVLLITTAFINIFWKEISECYHNKNYDLARDLFNKTCNIVFFLSFFIAAFLIHWTDEILLELFHILDSKQSFALCILFVLPAFQAICQLSTTFLLAISKPKKVVQVNYIFIIVSLFASYFVLSGKENIIPGFELGSLGLSVKLFIMSVLQTSYFLFIINKILNQSFNFSVFFRMIIVCFSLSFISVYIVKGIFSVHSSLIVIFLFSGFLYVKLILIYSYYFYESLGFHQNFISIALSKFKILK
jgi:O-antigen/teichoic acid export membrane protein